jgi:hypothetical protein
MNNFADIQVDVKDAQGQYELRSPVIAEIVKIIKVEGNSYTIVALRDFTGVEKTALIRGKAKPTYAEIGQVKVLSLSAKTDPSRGVMYSGFYNPQDPIPPEFAGRRPPAPTNAAQGAQGGGGKSSYDNGKNRGFALSYAKDLVVAGKVDITKITSCVDTFTAYLDTGNWPSAQPAQAPVQQQQAAPPTYQAPVQAAPIIPAAQIEREIPEMGGVQADPFAGNQDPYGQGPAVGQSIGQVTGQAVGAVPYQKEDIPF